MRGRLFPAIALAALAFVMPARAADVTIAISDGDGHPVANAVVMLVPDAKAGMPVPSARLAPEQIIDQRNETFIPLVTILPRGGHLVFTNNDHTMHQVYSFSPIKQFEFTLPHGQKSPAIVFDKPGVAAIGCNIHDHMIAYAFVSDSPWAAQSAADGRVEIADVPAGNYTAQIWHPQLPVGSAPSQKVTVGAEPVLLKATIALIDAPTMHHMHGGDY
jgi:hypothetical protein